MGAGKMVEPQIDPSNDSSNARAKLRANLLEVAMKAGLGFSKTRLKNAITKLVQVYGSIEEACTWIQRDNFTILVDYILEHEEVSQVEEFTSSLDWSENDDRDVEADSTMIDSSNEKVLVQKASNKETNVRQLKRRLVKKEVTSVSSSDNLKFGTNAKECVTSHRRSSDVPKYPGARISTLNPSRLTRVVTNEWDRLKNDGMAMRLVSQEETSKFAKPSEELVVSVCVGLPLKGSHSGESRGKVPTSRQGWKNLHSTVQADYQRSTSKPATEVTTSNLLDEKSSGLKKKRTEGYALSMAMQGRQKLLHVSSDKIIEDSKKNDASQVTGNPMALQNQPSANISFLGSGCNSKVLSDKQGSAHAGSFVNDCKIIGGNMDQQTLRESDQKINGRMANSAILKKRSRSSHLEEGFQQGTGARTLIVSESDQKINRPMEISAISKKRNRSSYLEEGSTPDGSFVNTCKIIVGSMDQQTLRESDQKINRPMANAAILKNRIRSSHLEDQQGAGARTLIASESDQKINRPTTNSAISKKRNRFSHLEEGPQQGTGARTLIVSGCQNSASCNDEPASEDLISKNLEPKFLCNKLSREEAFDTCTKIMLPTKRFKSSSGITDNQVYNKISSLHTPAIAADVDELVNGTGAHILGENTASNKLRLLKETGSRSLPTRAKTGIDSLKQHSTHHKPADRTVIEVNGDGNRAENHFATEDYSEEASHRKVDIVQISSDADREQNFIPSDSVRLLFDDLELMLRAGDSDGALQVLTAYKNEAFKGETGYLAIKAPKNSLLLEAEDGGKQKLVPDVPGRKAGFVVSYDISRGLEKLPISCVNEYNAEVLPEDFLYMTSSVIAADAHVDTSFSRIGDLHCVCSDDCLRSSMPCKCTDSTRGEYAYDDNGLLIQRLAMSFQSRYATENGDFITECCAKCQCSMNCGNRVVQRGITKRLQVFMTRGKKGWGVRALDFIPARSFVFEYIGEIATNEEQSFRNKIHEEKGTHTYTMNLDADFEMEEQHFGDGLNDTEALVLDATNFGNVSRFVNHRCGDANLFLRPVQIETRDTHYYHAALFAVRDIEEMEELTWDYGIDFNDTTHAVKAFKCHCNSQFCRDKKKKRKASASPFVR